MEASGRAITLEEDVLAEVERRAAAAAVDLDGYVNATLRRHMRLADPDPGAAPPALEVQRDAYLQALLDRNAPRAREVVDAALASGVPVADIYADVFAPALAEVGHMWALDKLNVAQEHYATSVTQTLIATLSAEAPAEAGAGRLAIVSSTPDELHLLGPQMVSDLLQREGWEVLNLGAATPAGDLIELVQAECPDLVALSATTAGRLHGVSEVLGLLAGLDPRPLVAVGGGLFSGQAAGLARELGADLVLTDVRDLVAALHERFPPLD
jgi:methanogenic corrinoid protein MtbC1